MFFSIFCKDAYVAVEVFVAEVLPRAEELAFCSSERRHFVREQICSSC